MSRSTPLGVLHRTGLAAQELPLRIRTALTGMRLYDSPRALVVTGLGIDDTPVALRAHSRHGPDHSMPLPKVPSAGAAWSASNSTTASGRTGRQEMGGEPARPPTVPGSPLRRTRVRACGCSSPAN